MDYRIQISIPLACPDDVAARQAAIEIKEKIEEALRYVSDWEYKLQRIYKDKQPRKIQL